MEDSLFLMRFVLELEKRKVTEERFLLAKTDEAASKRAARFLRLTLNFKQEDEKDETLFFNKRSETAKLLSVSKVTNDNVVNVMSRLFGVEANADKLEILFKLRDLLKTRLDLVVSTDEISV